MLKILVLCNGQTVIGLQYDNDHARLIRTIDPLLFKYVKQNDSWKMDFQPYDQVSMPREIRFRVEAMYTANEDQTRQYELARAIMFKTES